MAYVDIELELQVLRMNVCGLVGDVHEVEARAASLQPFRGFRATGGAEPQVR